MKPLLFLFLLLSNLSAFAYSPGGVMVCGKRPILYSFYEGGNPHLHNIKLWKDDRSITREQYIVRAMLRMKEQSRVIYDSILPVLQHIQIIEAGFVTHEGLPEIPFVDQGCSYQEIADKQYDSKFLFVDMYLYPRLSPMGQAGVIIQELFFGFMNDVEEYKSDPDFARKFIANLFSDEPLGKKIDTTNMTADQKRIATSGFCTSSLNMLAKELKVFVETVEQCRKQEDKSGITSTFDKIKNLIHETVDGCQKNCLWDEGQKTCEDMQKTVDSVKGC